MALHEIFRKGWQWAIEEIVKFCGDPDHRLDARIVFRIRPYWEIRKVVNGHSFILIRQTAALVRRALAEVCTVPVPVVVLLPRFVGFHFSAPQCSHCKRCSIAIPSVCPSVRLSACHTAVGLLCQNDYT